MEAGTPPRAPLMEVFASIQGEGRYAGEPQVFLRLAGCPLRCTYCDTPASWALPRDPDWVTPFQAACHVREVEPGAARTVSVTGGEPLLWPGFVAALRTFLGPRRIHLETAGAHPAALERVLEHVDHVSLDLKAPEDLEPTVEIPAQGETERAPDGPPAWGTVRARVLPLLAGRDACAKVVVVGGTPAGAYDALLADVERLAPELPVVIQPATPVRGAAAPPQAELDAVLELALARGLEVRVLPQIHHRLGLP